MGIFCRIGSVESTPAMPKVPEFQPITGAAQNFVQDRFSVSADYADTLYAKTLELLSQMGQVDEPGEGEPDEYSVDDMTISPFSGTFTPLDYAMGTPENFFFEGMEPIPSIILGSMPKFNVADPSVREPDYPEVTWPTLTATEPTQADITIPPAPEYDLPPIPVFEAVNIPSAPSMEIPTFDHELPVDDLEPPNEMFVYNEEPYYSELLNQLSSEIYQELISGSTGLTPEVEEAIWARALSRLQEEDEKAYQEALNYFSSRNWSMPVGMLNGNLLEVRNGIAKRNLDINRDILVQSSDLAQKNRHFVLAQGVALEQLLTAHSNEVANRAFEAAKFTAQFAMEAYKARVEIYIARIEAIKSMAQVYESRIRAEIAKAELYKAQIEGARLEVEIQRHLMEVYKVQIAAIQAMMEIYRIKMQGAEIQSNIERNKVEVFKSHIDAYVAKVGANTARYEAYQAAWTGEGTKVEAYKGQVQAYATRVDAVKVESDIQYNDIQAKLATNNGRIQKYLGDVERYKADISRIVGEGEVSARFAGIGAQIYGEDVKAHGMEVDAAVRDYTAKIQELGHKVSLAVGFEQANAQRAIGYMDAVNRSKLAAAQVAGQLGAAALNSVSATASVGFTEGRSDTSSNSYNTGLSYSQSKSENHNLSCSANWSENHQGGKPHEYVYTNISA